MHKWMVDGKLDDEIAAHAARVARAGDEEGCVLEAGAFAAVLRAFDAVFASFATEWQANTFGYMDFNSVKARVVANAELRLAAGCLLSSGDD